MRIGLVALDKTGSVRLFNSAAEKILGYRAQDVRGMPCEPIFKDLAKTLTDLRGKKDGDQQETPFKINARHKDGRGVSLIGSVHVTPDTGTPSGGGGEVILLFEDALEVDKLENQLRHLNKLQSLDQFAAGVVHEIRNPLTGISTNVQYILENIGPKDRFHEEVKDILADVECIEDVTSRVLDYAHPSKSQVREEPVEKIVEEVLRILRMPLRRQGIRLSTNLDRSPVKVRVDVSQLKQVLLNIIRNACDAMPKGGELRVSTSRLEAVNCKAQVRVEVEDTGRGIAEEHLERIFDPFFSLNSEGMGLGLAISRKIIEDHGGRIDVKSKPGKGTRLGIVLPAV